MVEDSVCGNAGIDDRIRKAGVLAATHKVFNHRGLGIFANLYCVAKCWKYPALFCVDNINDVDRLLDHNISGNFYFYTSCSQGKIEFAVAVL